jgi:hypothetical protein
MCLGLTDEASCHNAGCIFQSGTFFPIANGSAPVCQGGTPISVCTYYVTTPFQSVSTWKRDVPGGRIAIGIGIVDSVEGFTECVSGTIDLCACFK